jgi:hypothetical protein
MFSDGSTAQFDLDGLPCPMLVLDLLAGLVELVHPHGSIDAAGTVTQYVQAFRQMARRLSASGFTGQAADLRRPHLIEYWLGTSGPQEACTRRALAAFARNGGAVDPGVAELAAGRNFNPLSFRRPLPPYREAEWERLAAACAEAAGTAFAAHKEALAAAARGAHPGEGGWSRENLTWLLARTGPAGAARFGELAGCSHHAVLKQGGFHEVSADLFPPQDVVISYRLLFGVYSGIVPDGIEDLATGDIDWAGDASVLLSYVKRRTAAESLNLPRRAVRLLEQWLAHSALLRSLVAPGDRERLWLGTFRPGGSSLITRIDPSAIQRWAQRHNVTSDDGGLLKIHRSRIRTTHLSLRDKSAWAGRGRATIDPNNGPGVEGDHYLTVATPAQQRSVEAIIADAQHDLLRRAHPPAVLTDDDTAELTRDYPHLVATLGLDDTVLAELVGGERDVFTAACADQLSGLHGPKGQPCPARPWICLLCPLAIFAPRHAASLLRLKAFFSRQWQRSPPPTSWPSSAPTPSASARSWTATTPPSWNRPPATSPTTTADSRYDPRSAPDDHRPSRSRPAPGQVAVRRSRHLPAGRPHAPGRGPQADVRRRPLGLYRRVRASRVDAPLGSPVQLHADHQPAMADGRQGNDLRDAGPQA